MPNAQNVETLAKIKEEVAAASAVWVVDYRGLTVKEAQQLRRDIREAGAHLTVYKNTLMHIAAEELGFPNLDAMLDGPSAFVFGTGDPVAPAKAIKEFAKAHEAMEVKGGMMDNQFMDADQVKAIADLPSREEMIAKVVGCLANPLNQIVRVLNAPMSGLAQVVNQVAEQKPAA
jgi:large subunit ribosomal protein L10